jgi:hypothetical protein
LLNLEGEPLYVRPDAVRAVWPSLKKGCAVISLEDSSVPLTVKGTSEEVEQALRAAER